MNDFTLDKKIKWYQWTISYLSWIVTVMLGFVIFFMARAAIRVLFFDFVINGGMGQDVAAFLDKLLVLIFSLVILSFIIFSQDYFYKAVGRNILLTRFLRILGIEFLTLFIFNTIFAIPKCFSPGGINLLLLVGFELVAGIVMMIYSFRSREGKAP